MADDLDHHQRWSCQWAGAVRILRATEIEGQLVCARTTLFRSCGTCSRPHLRISGLRWSKSRARWYRRRGRRGRLMPCLRASASCGSPTARLRQRLNGCASVASYRGGCTLMSAGSSKICCLRRSCCAPGGRFRPKLRLACSRRPRLETGW